MSLVETGGSLLIKREILSQLRKHLSKPEITVITGPRQSGKTTLVKILQKELQEKGKKPFISTST